MIGHDLYTFEHYDPFNERHVGYARQIEDVRSREEPVVTMLPLGPEIMANHTIGVVVTQDDEPVAYNAVIFEYGNGVAEVGGLYVHPEHRNRGLTKPIKAELFETVRRLKRIHTVITFANESSLQLNLNLGFSVAEPDEVPEQSLANCVGCPRVCEVRQLGNICCDTILSIKTADLPELPFPTNRIVR